MIITTKSWDSAKFQPGTDQGLEHFYHHHLGYEAYVSLAYGFGLSFFAIVAAWIVLHYFQMRKKAYKLGLLK